MVGGTTVPGMRAILEGIRVVDMTQYLSGPTVTRLMAELGAEVIKIEQAPYGDPTRSLAIMKDGRSGYFVQQNRGKRSVCLDFKHADGRRVLDALLAKADVFVENYGPGVLDRHGLDWPSLHVKHPRLIMGSISGFGKDKSVDPAFGSKTAFDTIAQAYSGFMHLTGPADGPPMLVGMSFADVMSGVHTLAGVGLALFDRERTGRGQWVDIAMVDSLFHAQDLAVQGSFLTGGKWQAKRGGSRSAATTPVGAIKAPEGYIAIHVAASQWAGFCRAMGRPDLEKDERFADLRSRHQNRQVLYELIEAWMATFPNDAAVLAALDAERVPCAPVMNPGNTVGHPYFESRRTTRVVKDPILGEVAIPGNPLRLSEQPEDLDLVAPLLGEHNGAVLAELGYGPEEIADLEASGVLRSAAT